MSTTGETIAFDTLAAAVDSLETNEIIAQLFLKNVALERSLHNLSERVNDLKMNKISLEDQLRKSFPKEHLRSEIRRLFSTGVIPLPSCEQIIGEIKDIRFYDYSQDSSIFDLGVVFNSLSGETVCVDFSMTIVPKEVKGKPPFYPGFHMGYTQIEEKKAPSKIVAKKKCKK